MAGLNAIESKLRTLDAVAVEKQWGDYVSVVYFDMITGEVDWPDNPVVEGVGILLAPIPLSADEWQRLGAEWLEKKSLVKIK